MATTVEIRGLKELISDVKQAGIDAKPLVKAALTNSASKMQSNIRQRAPHRTGALQRSVQVSMSYPSASVEVLEKYGTMVEYGTPPHIIKPKNKKALYWKGAHNPYKSVRHPGTKARPFFQPGVDASEEFILQQFTKVAEKLIMIMAGK